MKKLVSLVLFLFLLSGCEVSSIRRSKSSVKSISRIPMGASLQKSQPITRSLTKTRSLSSSSPSAVKLPNLKAVLLLGGELDAETMKEYEGQLKASAKALRERNVAVIEFYNGGTEGQILAALKDANFVFYAGHGIGDPNPPSYIAQGLDGSMWLYKAPGFGGDHIRKWPVKKGALVFLIGACFSAGNSSEDYGKINAAEAKRRISLYSEPYLESRFRGYFASWSTEYIIEKLFKGETLGQASGLDYPSEFGRLLKYDHPAVSGDKLWSYEGLKGSAYSPIYGSAFAGDPNQTLTTLFSGSADENKKPAENIESVKYNEKQSLNLIRSIYRKDSKAAFAALDSKADPNTAYKGWSALLLAVKFKETETAKRLIKEKADLNFELKGWNALRLAENSKQTEVAALLKNAGAKLPAVSRSLNFPAIMEEPEEGPK